MTTFSPGPFFVCGQLETIPFHQSKPQISLGKTTPLPNLCAHTSHSACPPTIAALSPVLLAVRRSPPLHTVVLLISSGPLNALISRNDIPGMKKAWNPAQKGEQDVEAEVRSASTHDQHRCGWEEDGEDVEDDACLEICQ